MSTSNQNSDDEEIDFQSHLLKLEQEYDGSTLNNQNCIRVKKPGGGNFSIKIPVNQGGGDYLVVQKYKTADMEKVESKERWKTSTFNAKIILDEKDKADNAIILAFNNLQDLMMDKFMCNDDKQIESYQ
ncbi:unnamed protein product [Macrosiphum euphorbiae]|uniref:Uncharacterized protein n=1 Tax=Macrosiphum euphorbiae TaxID=13131 RepID=A0AAV0XQM1_9HEMI|nr:unnamed protein product [Macrosiphum euphorbiae]